MDGSRSGYKRPRSPDQGPSRQAENSDCIIKVRGDQLEEDSLSRCFSDFGTITNIKVNRYDAIITFDSPKSATRSLDKSGILLNGNRLEVSLASGRPQASSPSTQISSNELYVSNLPNDVRYQDVQSFFAPYGEVQRVNVGPRGTYVRFRTSREAEEAVEKLNGVLFQGSRINIQIKRQPTNDQYPRRQDNGNNGYNNGGHNNGYNNGGNRNDSGPAFRREKATTEWGNRDDRNGTIEWYTIKEDEEMFSRHNTEIGVNFDQYDNIPVECTDKSIVPLENFDELELAEQIKSNLERLNYKKPTPIQKYSIPTGLRRMDLMACAQTGSGKTAAFLFPICHKMIEEGPPTRVGNTPAPVALVLAPTRELARQIFEEARKVASRTGIRAVVIHGGAEARTQMRDLYRGVDILVATPGRLIDYMTKGIVTCVHVKYLVLDESDRMLDMGFEPQIRAIVLEKDMPTERETHMFSATFPKEIRALANTFLHKHIFLSIGRVGSTSDFITQQIVQVEDHEKTQELLKILEENKGGKVLVFVEMKRTANEIDRFLNQNRIRSTSIHGDRTQPDRDRALERFRRGDIQTLVATDVAARGLDIKGVEIVVNYDMPSNIEDYVHRIGRTGRAGQSGKGIAFINEKNKPVVKHLMKLLKENKQEVPGWFEEMYRKFGREKFEKNNRYNAGRNFRGRGSFGNRPPFPGNRYGHQQFNGPMGPQPFPSNRNHYSDSRQSNYNTRSHDYDPRPPAPNYQSSNNGYGRTPYPDPRTSSYQDRRQSNESRQPQYSHSNRY